MIQVNKEFLKNESYIQNVIVNAKKQMKLKQKRYERYTRNKKGINISVALENYMVNIASGFFGGIEPTVSVKQETNDKKKNKISKLFNQFVGKNADALEFQLFIDKLRELNNDGAVYYDLVKDYFITGSAYALQYENELNELRYGRVSPTGAVALYDYGTPPQAIGLIRIWKEADNKGELIEIVEIITNEEKIYYKNNKKTYKLEEELTQDIRWKLLPVMAIENPDNLSLFSVVEPLIDALEQIIDNNKETFQQNADAKLIAIGYAPENDMIITDDNGNDIVNPARIMEDNAVLDAKMLYIPETDSSRGDFKWLLKELNDVASENHKKTLIDLIFMIACVPNVSDVGFTNADNSSALEKKFFPLEQIVIQAEKQFRKEYMELYENFVDRINTKYSTNFDYNDIDIKFKRNLPTNEADVVNTWLSLRGLISDKTIIENLPYEIDVETEEVRLEEQDEASIMKFTKEVDYGLGDSKQDTEEVFEELQE